MGLEELQRRGGLHLGRDHTYQIVFDTDAVHRRDLAVIHDEFQRTGKGLVLLPFPMEINAYRHSVKDERGLGEQRRARNRIEHELVI